jgi:hypothetical protein
VIRSRTISRSLTLVRLLSHHSVMRPILSLKDDEIKDAQVYAPGGACHHLGIGERDGFPVVDVPDDFPPITSERVRELLDEE